MSVLTTDSRVSPLFDEATVARVRRCRYAIKDDREIGRLVLNLEHLDRAVGEGNRAAAEAIIRRSPPGCVRDCLADIVDHHFGNLSTPSAD